MVCPKCVLLATTSAIAANAMLNEVNPNNYYINKSIAIGIGLTVMTISAATVTSVIYNSINYFWKNDQDVADNATESIGHVPTCHEVMGETSNITIDPL